MRGEEEDVSVSSLRREQAGRGELNLHHIGMSGMATEVGGGEVCV